jgi:predicted metal-dependent enzyme (double-stranded beta helix superfamily)
MTNVRHPRFTTFIDLIERLVDDAPGEPTILEGGSALLRKLIAHDDWLPEAYATHDPKGYTQYLLHVDPRERFSVVSFVWGPGQKSPIHNHTVWGLIGVLRGSEYSQGYVQQPDGSLLEAGSPILVHEGSVEAVSPSIGDLHAVSNALTDRTSISIHVYGADIGKVQRTIFQLDGTTKSFISGYSNASTVANYVS